jgi:hypothetical protein
VHAGLRLFGQIIGGTRAEAFCKHRAEFERRITMTDQFQISDVAIGLGNKDYYRQQSFAQAYITLGPFKFTGYLTAQGEVSLPESLRDKALAHAITVALRAAVLDRIRSCWQRKNEVDTRRLTERGALPPQRSA